MTQIETMIRVIDAWDSTTLTKNKDGRLWQMIEEMRQALEEALAKQEQGEPERCHGCEACINTACGRDECPKGWPKAPQPKQEQGEPVAWMDKENHDVIVSAKDWDNIDPLWYWMYRPLYTTPQQRTWVGLTDEEIDELHGSPMELEHSGALKWVRIIEDKLKEKNTK